MPDETENILSEIIRKFGTEGNAEIAHYIEKDLLVPI